MAPPTVIITSTICHPAKDGPAASGLRGLRRALWSAPTALHRLGPAYAAPGMPSVMRGVRPMVMCAPRTPSASDTPGFVKLTRPNRVLMRIEIGNP